MSFDSMFGAAFELPFTKTPTNFTNNITANN